MAIRPLTEADIPQVADLYWNYLRRRNGPAPPRIQKVLHELCFDSPFIDPEIRPVVFEAEDGGIGGFSGAVIRKMSACGQPIRVVLGGNLVVHPKFRSAHVGQSIVENFFSQNADLAVLDSANDAARKILLKNAFRIIPSLNLHWRRVLRPARYGLCGMSVASGPVMSAGLKLAAGPICWATDGVAAKMSRRAFRLKPPRLRGTELNSETLLQCLVESRKGYSLWPEYDLSSLDWLLGFMARRAARGTLRKVALTDDAGKVVGWYIYYVNSGAVSEVVQIGGDLQFTKDVLDHLFYDAWQRGVAGLHGLLEMRRMADFSDRHCFFTCRGGWTMARSPYPELLKLLDADTLFTRLDGEWCLDIGD